MKQRLDKRCIVLRKNQPRPCRQHACSDFAVYKEFRDLNCTHACRSMTMKALEFKIKTCANAVFL